MVKGNVERMMRGDRQKITKHIWMLLGVELGDRTLMKMSKF
jgi:hypothetical protein